MPYDIVDAYEDINTINEKLNQIISLLIEKGIIPKPKEEDKDART